MKKISQNSDLIVSNNNCKCKNCQSDISLSITGYISKLDKINDKNEELIIIYKKIEKLFENNEKLSIFVEVYSRLSYSNTNFNEKIKYLEKLIKYYEKYNLFEHGLILHYFFIIKLYLKKNDSEKSFIYKKKFIDYFNLYYDERFTKLFENIKYLEIPNLDINNKNIIDINIENIKDIHKSIIYDIEQIIDKNNYEDSNYRMREVQNDIIEIKQNEWTVLNKKDSLYQPRRLCIFILNFR
jgi:hypothetical protein